MILWAVTWSKRLNDRLQISQVYGRFSDQWQINRDYLREAEAWSNKVSSSLQHHRLTRVCYHVAFQLIRRDELFVTSVAFKYFVYLRYKSKKQSESIWSFVLADRWKKFRGNELRKFKDLSVRWSTETKSCPLSLDWCLQTEKQLKWWKLSIPFLLHSTVPVIAYSIAPRRTATIAYANVTQLLLSAASAKPCSAKWR